MITAGTTMGEVSQVFAKLLNSTNVGFRNHFPGFIGNVRVQVVKLRTCNR